VPSSVLRTLTGRRGLLVLGAAVLLLVVAVVVVVSRDGGDAGPVPTGHDVVVIMTDDQTLASLATMPHVQELLVEQGTSYTAAVASFPNCCPSRATYLTGQYAHTTGVVDNVEPWGGAGHFDDDRALPVALEQAGYDTIHVGKYLNGWGEDGDIEPPPGWTRWFGLIDPSTYGYTDFDVSVDGSERSFGPDDYSTDVLADEAVAQIRAREGDERPLFLSFTPLAPHAEAPEAHAAAAAGEEPAGEGGFTTPVAPERHAEAFSADDVPRPPSYDEEDVGDKPINLRRAPLSPSSTEYIDRYLTAELGALAAVDDAVERIVDALDETGRLDDTVIVFTSDNGFLHGEHRFVFGKYVLYEPSIRVPLVIRGPGFGAGVEVDTPVANVDLAPTIAAAALVDLLDPPDGVSLNGPLVLQAEDRPVLLENYDGGEPNDRGVRTRRWSLITHLSGERELYDLAADPDQLENLAGDEAVAQVERDLMVTLRALQDCRGAECDVPVPPSARVAG
jgi:N-acetylglucosamine-6-sulfatase